MMQPAVPGVQINLGHGSILIRFLMLRVYCFFSSFFLIHTFFLFFSLFLSFFLPFLLFLLFDSQFTFCPGSSRNQGKAGGIRAFQPLMHPEVPPRSYSLRRTVFVIVNILKKIGI
ncbi:hypothetical protein BDQ94DRAFT_142153 [Aspergillus welwitschiae]|uniref:Uncharacterized protein n=1 Tax=Aspergillus welwitschiae TaxID=1341132 RepID=A0A3F3Q4X5_9EURO|nr:hypothetical protein BDQ94DRAFT_142153 [Aspergillus welwitschiae]RDH34145.1 hypothetical protein BDQ94DRAFT_142153 [Aspergillus welwitschiae]